MILRASTIALSLSLSLTLMGCLAATPGPDAPAGDIYGDVYAGLPELTRETFTVTITGEQDSCIGLTGTPKPCFVGTTPLGARLKFDQGIEGYTFRQGVSEDIIVDRITYDMSAPGAPQDLSSVRYTMHVPIALAEDG